MTEVATGESTLNWDVLVTPGIATIASDRAPRTKQLMWSPISSTFIPLASGTLSSSTPLLPSSKRTSS